MKEKEKSKNSFSKYFEGNYFQYLVLIVTVVLLTFLFGPRVKEKLTDKAIIYDYTHPPDLRPDQDAP